VHEYTGCSIFSSIAYIIEKLLKMEIFLPKQPIKINQVPTLMISVPRPRPFFILESGALNFGEIC